MNGTEEFLTRLMNDLADKFKNELILKGGILLRLQGSPRKTQDLDYVWIQSKKRTLFARELKENLEKMDGVEVVRVETNSRGIFLQVKDQAKGTLAKIEISVEKETFLPPESASTARLSNLYSMKTQVIPVMNLSEAFSHKIAAALERDLVRDLYDLMQWQGQVPFDEKTLRERLSRLEIGRSKPKSVGLEEAMKMLSGKIEALTKKKVTDELQDFVPKEELVGLDKMIRASVLSILRRLEVLNRKEGQQAV